MGPDGPAGTIRCVTKTAPRAFSGSRLQWSDLPRHVRARIVDLAGAEVTSETSATTGFSPGFASVLELGDGTRVFVKAVSPEQNPESPGLARKEIVVAAALPPGVCAPPLLWSDDDGAWVLLGFEAVDGVAPRLPWDPAELRRVLGALTDLADAGTPAPPGLPDLATDMADVARGWERLAEDGSAVDRALEAVGRHGPWMHENLGALARWAADGPTAGAGDTLVHGDIRADNVLLSPDQVWLIDWPHACSGGSRWWDLLAMLPSVAMQDGGDPETIFWGHPNAAGADRDAVRAVLAGVAGFFVHGAVQPPPPGLTNLRPFQLAQGVEALDWLRRF